MTFLGMTLAFLFSLAWGGATGCGDTRSRNKEPRDAGVSNDSLVEDVDASTVVDAEPADAEVEPDAAPEPDAYVPTSCNFDYDTTFVYLPPQPKPNPAPPLAPADEDSSPIEKLKDRRPKDRRPGSGYVAHVEPAPKGTFRLPQAHATSKDPADIVMPSYSDNMPLFDRGTEWSQPTRCYETPLGVMMLTEPEAYDLYKDIAELTTGVAMNTALGVRTVVGLRGAYPGRLLPHDNLPNRFNDTLVLLWLDANGLEHVREFPVNTDTGAYDFGYHSSSSLRPNRRYFYINGWHRSYNALHIDEYSYLVWDDANKNCHWDSDRNA